MTIIEQIKAEIERHLNSATKHQNANPDMPKYRWYLYEGEKELCTDLLGYIDDSLESEKQMFPISVTMLDNDLNPVEITAEEKQINQDGLKEEISRYLREECSNDDEPSISEIARHFAKWGAENLKK